MNNLKKKWTIGSFETKVSNWLIWNLNEQLDHLNSTLEKMLFFFSEQRSLLILLHYNFCPPVSERDMWHILQTSHLYATDLVWRMVLTISVYQIISWGINWIKTGIVFWLLGWLNNDPMNLYDFGLGFKFGLILWHINHYRLFNAKSIFIHKQFYLKQFNLA